MSDQLVARWSWLSEQPAPPVPAGVVGAIANRMMIYARPDQVPAVLPLVDRGRGGLILAGARVRKRMRLLGDSDYDGVVLADPAQYEEQAATPDKPFVFPNDQLVTSTLTTALDDQLTAGATAALTPTGYITAGDTDSLKAAVRHIQRLDRTDTIFVAPLDISLVDRAYITQTTAILADAGCPVAVVLGKQGDPLKQSKWIIPNLRNLAAQVPLVALRTDFNAFDLVAHGAIAGGIGTGGKLRHTVEPPKTHLSYSPDPSPSVLFPELLCWWKGTKIAKLYGSRLGQAPMCFCSVCTGQRLTRFLARTDQNEALCHAIAAWTPRAADMLDAVTLRDRAEYWRNMCTSSVKEHAMITERLRLVGPLTPQVPITRWANLPAWPIEASAPTAS